MDTRICLARCIDAPKLGQGGVKNGQSVWMGMPAGGCFLGRSVHAEPNGLRRTIWVAPLDMPLRRTWPHYPPRWASEKQKEHGDISCPLSGFLDDGHDYTY
jgi:hypothetical protein